MKPQENKHLRQKKESPSDLVHIVLVGRDEHFGNTGNGKQFNPSLLEIDTGISVDQKAIVSVVISGNESVKWSWNSEIQEVWHYTSGLTYQRLGGKVVVTFIPYGLLQKMHSCKTSDGKSLLYNYIRQSKVCHIAFCDFFPYKSDNFDKMINENWHKEYNLVSKSILIVGGLNNFSENDISTESESVEDAQKHYKQKEWNTVICTKQITAFNLCQSLATGLTLRKDKVEKMILKIHEISRSLDPETLNILAVFEDLDKNNYKSIGDFIDNAIGKMIKETLIDSYHIFQIVCPDWKTWVEEKLSEYKFPTRNASKTKKALDIIINEISNYYNKQAKQFQQK